MFRTWGPVALLQDLSATSLDHLRCISRHACLLLRLNGRCYLECRYNCPV